MYPAFHQSHISFQVKLSTDDILATIDGISDTYRPLPRPIFHEESVPSEKTSSLICIFVENL